jgi:hypothetical protein
MVYCAIGENDILFFVLFSLWGDPSEIIKVIDW